MTWMLCGECLLCGAQLQQARFPSAGYTSVRCKGCGSLWNGPIGQAENVAAAAAAHDPGIHPAGARRAAAAERAAKVRDEHS